MTEEIKWLIGIVIVFIGVVFPIYIYFHKQKKLRPSMPSAQVIYDEYGARIAFTVVSKNPNGSVVKKMPLKVELITPSNWYKPNKVIVLPFQSHEDYISSKNIHYNSFPEWKLIGQKTFAAPFNAHQLPVAGHYRLTFFTEDGNCTGSLGYVPLPIPSK